MLYQMLRETHHIKKKLVVLSRNSGHSLLSLATAIINHLPGQTHTEVSSPSVPVYNDHLFYLPIVLMTLYQFTVLISLVTEFLFFYLGGSIQERADSEVVWDSVRAAAGVSTGEVA